MEMEMRIALLPTDAAVAAPYMYISTESEWAVQGCAFWFSLFVATSL
jgi:hypothetical protein